MDNESFDLPELPQSKIVAIPAPDPVLVGRPTIYDKEIAYKIVEEIATNAESLKSICLRLGIVYSTVRRWIRDNPEFRDLYLLAKEDQSDELVDSALEDTETIVPERDTAAAMMVKLKVETKLKIAGQLNPRKWQRKGDTTVNVNVTDHSKEEFSDILAAVKRKKQEQENRDRNGQYEEAIQV